MPGTYTVGSRISDEDAFQKLAHADDIFKLRVAAGMRGDKTNAAALIRLNGEWRVDY